MTNLIENSSHHTEPEAFGGDVPTTPQEDFVTDVYASIDEATAGELCRLRNEDGITESCELGCCHCCRYHIIIGAAEAHTLAQYIKRELSSDQMRDIRIRTQQWHEWDNSRPGRYPMATPDEQTDLSDYVPCCPLLVDGACIAYPVRPVVCRTHFVCSHPLFCRAATDPQLTEDAPVVLKSIVTATSPFSKAIEDDFENAGSDFSRSLVLLPHGLAIEMDWDFALSV